MLKILILCSNFQSTSVTKSFSSNIDSICAASVLCHICGHFLVWINQKEDLQEAKVFFLPVKSINHFFHSQNCACNKSFWYQNCIPPLYKIFRNYCLYQKCTVLSLRIDRTARKCDWNSLIINISENGAKLIRSW